MIALIIAWVLLVILLFAAALQPLLKERRRWKALMRPRHRR